MSVTADFNLTVGGSATAAGVALSYERDARN